MKMKSLILSLLFLTSSAKAEQTYYPLEGIELLKIFSAPLSDESDCNAGGGLIAEINCHLAKFGVDGPGTFYGAEVDGCLFKIDVEKTDGKNEYEYVMQAYADCSQKDGNDYRHFLNYWVSHQGKSGRVELLPHLTNDNPSEEVVAILLSWSSVDPRAQVMTATVEVMKDRSDLSWSNRKMALQIQVVVDETLGTASASFAFNGIPDAGLVGENQAQEQKKALTMNLVRNKTHTFVQGSLCDENIESCEVGTYQCVENTGSILSRGEVLEQADSLEAISSEGSCGDLKPQYSIRASAITEAQAGLLSQEGLLTLKR